MGHYNNNAQKEKEKSLLKKERILLKHQEMIWFV